MGDVVNLRQARKLQDRAARDAAASANRVKFGRSAIERARDARERNDRDRLLDGKRMSDGASDGEAQAPRPEGKG